MRITASDFIHAIGRLPRDRTYNYINPSTTTKIIIEDVVYPEGPIKIKRYDPSKGKGMEEAKEQSISTKMLWRVANAFVTNYPVQIDRVLGASFNTRSTLEALIAHTPEFYYCYPGRIEIIESTSGIKQGHKHLMWCPDNPHKEGIMCKMETDIVISEIRSNVIYDSLILPEPKDYELDIDIKRRHAQIQLALLMIGKQLGSLVWIAKNDKNIEYRGEKIGEMEGVIPSLRNLKLLTSFSEAIRAALMIDVIWFRNSKFMPAVFEIEHSTGVTSGLSRMKNFQDVLPPFETRWVIVAPDEIRDKVFKEANKTQFNSLNAQFFPYSGVEELYSLCQRRKIKGVTDEFLDSFMEPCVV